MADLDPTRSWAPAHVEPADLDDLAWPCDAAPPDAEPDAADPAPADAPASHRVPSSHEVVPFERPRPRTTRVVLDRGTDAFSRLGPDERRRLLVRVLCELVAYDADRDVDLRRTRRLAG